MCWTWQEPQRFFWLTSKCIMYVNSFTHGCHFIQIDMKCFKYHSIKFLFYLLYVLLSRCMMLMCLALSYTMCWHSRSQYNVVMLMSHHSLYFKWYWIEEFTNNKLSNTIIDIFLGLMPHGLLYVVMTFYLDLPNVISIFV